MEQYLVRYKFPQLFVPLVAAALMTLSFSVRAQTDVPNIPRVESVRSLINQPIENDPDLIWFDDFDTDLDYTEKSGPSLDNSVWRWNSPRTIRSDCPPTSAR